MGSILFGSDMSITNVSMSGSNIALQEISIREALDAQLV